MNSLLQVENVDREALTAWMERVRALRTELSRPIDSTEDPRARLLAEGVGLWLRSLEDVQKEIDNGRAADLGELYFDTLGAKGLLPPAPIPIAPWADLTRYYTIDWPEVHVEHLSAQYDVGTVSVWIEHATRIAVEDATFSNGERLVAGQVTAVVEPTVYVRTDPSLDAVTLSMSKLPAVVEALTMLECRSSADGDPAIVGDVLSGPVQGKQTSYGDMTVDELDERAKLAGVSPAKMYTALKNGSVV